MTFLRETNCTAEALCGPEMSNRLGWYKETCCCVAVNKASAQILWLAKPVLSSDFASASGVYTIDTLVDVAACTNLLSCYVTRQRTPGQMLRLVKPVCYLIAPIGVPCDCGS